MVKFRVFKVVVIVSSATKVEKIQSGKKIRDSPCKEEEYSFILDRFKEGLNTLFTK